MDQTTQFNSVLQLATLLSSTTNPLRRSITANNNLYEEAAVNGSDGPLKFKLYEASDFRVLAFAVCKQHHLQSADLVPSSILKDPNAYNFPHFEFLCTQASPSFSVNKTAIDLFCSNPQRDQLCRLKSKIDSSAESTPLIVTGHGLGGPIASLFTLWLLDTIGLGKKRPLCITFGSPLIGDQNLQKAISRSPTWNFCFLHLVSFQDPIPRSFISHDTYKPFGTFLLCSEYGASCFENPDLILDLLMVMGSSMPGAHQELQPHHYKEVVDRLNRMAICKAISARAENMEYSSSLQASNIVQLQALGIAQIQHQNIDMNGLINKMGEQKRRTSIRPGKLDDMKINMANLEWYKKESKAKGGYYDCFKKKYRREDVHVVQYKKGLTLYWTDMVKEVEMKPQREGVAFRTRWLFAATNYRRMVEPLDIADYYSNGGKDYQLQGRSPHYIQLQKWLEEDIKASGKLNSTEKHNVELILTLDSCFWAHVEEALISCQVLSHVQSSVEEKEDARVKLKQFENYVYGLLKKYEVSPEIFLEESSYMKWWKEYKAIMGSSQNQALASFMSCKDNYMKYSEGAFDF